ncbi:MAG TPA: phosphoribosylanthranilate isomerase [Candidatus Dormibacteraeota bacterium]|nr:phosphoribosylanthranilate isomerase [Candidatus Dormibacteraeota bacterium]
MCGITSEAEAELAVECGADGIGLILASSPRQISFDRAVAITRSLPPFITPTVVMVDPAEHDVREVADAIPNALLQFSGEEAPELVALFRYRAIKAIHVTPESDADAILAQCNRFIGSNLLLDTAVGALRGGSGRTFPWRIARNVAASRRIVLAGGLNAQNVYDAINEVRPYAVDVRSGIEAEGKKSKTRMLAFVEEVRRADRA